MYVTERLRFIAMTGTLITLTSCGDGSLFSGTGNNTKQGNKSAVRSTASVVDNSADLEDYLRDETNLSEAFEAIETKTIIELMNEIIDLNIEFRIYDNEWTVKGQTVSNLLSNSRSLRDLIEENDELASLTIEEILSKNGGAQDAIIAYGYDGVERDLPAQANAYSESADPEEIVQNTVRSAQNATDGEPLSTKSGKSDKDLESPVIEQSSPACKANQTNRSRVNTSAITGFSLAVAISEFCKISAAKMGRTAVKDKRCSDAMVMAGVGIITGASAILGKFKVDADNACPSAGE
jgi:hypothetical protein